MKRQPARHACPLELSGAGMARARMALRQRLQETADLLPSRQRFQVLPPRQVRVRCQ